MQMLPVIGTAALIGAAGFAAWTAVHHPRMDIAVVGSTQPTPQSGAPAQRIDLTPNARNDAFYTAILDRPLFAETRRPSVPQATEPAPVETPQRPQTPTETPPLPPPDIRLLGVLSGGAREAALLSIAGMDPEWHDIGSDIEGWRLARIAPQEILLTQKDRTHSVALYQR